MNTSSDPAAPAPDPTQPAKVKKAKIPRQPMPEQDPRRRRTNFEEVPRGYGEETAMLEASRCIQCKKPGCVGAALAGPAHSRHENAANGRDIREF